MALQLCLVFLPHHLLQCHLSHIPSLGLFKLTPLHQQPSSSHTQHQLAPPLCSDLSKLIPFSRMPSCTIFFRSNLPLTNSQSTIAFPLFRKVLYLHLLELIFYTHLPYRMVSSIWAVPCQFLLTVVSPSPQQSDSNYAGAGVDSEFCLFMLRSKVLSGDAGFLLLLLLYPSSLSASFVFLYICELSWWIRDAFFIWTRIYHYYFFFTFIISTFLFVPRSVFFFSAILMNRL